MTVVIPKPVFDRLLKAEGKIESGMLANMRTYLLPREPKIHTRILGEDRTLCGRSLYHCGRWAWQFINRGTFNLSLPQGADGRERCTRCAASSVILATKAATDARRTSFRVGGRR